MHRLRLSLLIVALVGVLAACASGTGSPSAAPSVAEPSAAPSVAAPSEAPSAAAASPSAAAASARPPQTGNGTVSVVESEAHGPLLVDNAGLTLYAFLNDTGGESTCYDECATNWPPLVLDLPPTAGNGAEAGKLTLVPRTDGTMQVKYGDYPLYYFAGDAAAGEVNGQGANDVWFVVSGAGEPVRE